MKTIKLKLGETSYTAALLTITQYKCVMEAFAKIQHSVKTSDPMASLAGTEMLLGVLQEAIFRVDGKTTLEDLADSVGLAEMVEALVDLANASNAMPKIGERTEFKMATASKLASVTGRAIEPSLKQFIDEVLVPMLVRDAVREMKNQIHIAPASTDVAQSTSERGRS